MITQDQKHIIVEVLAPFSPEEIAVFGSYARNEQRPDSDLDILVSFQARINLFDLVGIEQELSDKLGVKVDLVTRNAL
ncbi:MAG: nucleotidyltransferase family protein, partial [Bacteroidota bacterium]